MKRNKIGFLIIFLVFIMTISGCAIVLQTGTRSDANKIETLKQELEELRSTKRALEDKLSQEIKDKQVSLNMQDKGLVITFVAEVLFDSGKAILKDNSLSIIDKVAEIVMAKIPQYNIGIEGHTDNEPIKHSRWESNWELSAHRALSVLHYLESRGINPVKLSALGYGEYQPVASNDTAEGRALNRRVEVVILPKLVKKLEQESLDEKEKTEEFYEEEELK